MKFIVGLCKRVDESPFGIVWAAALFAALTLTAVFFLAKMISCPRTKTKIVVVGVRG